LNALHSEGSPDHVGTLYQDDVSFPSSAIGFTQKGMAKMA
jgi:hypothetical protein